MIELKGKYTDAKIFATTIEKGVYQQVYDIINCPAFEGQKVVCMPDVHIGAAGPCGLVATIGNFVCPEHIGCLDRDTEILTPLGWIKISDYDGQEILQYCVETDTAKFIHPKRYIKEPCNEFYYFHSDDNALDQMLSEEHKMLVFLGQKKNFHFTIKNPTFFNSIKSIEKGYYRFKASFKTAENGINISDELIRVDIMVQADGYLTKWKNGKK